MKKISLLLTLILIIGCVGCASNKGSDSSKKEPVQEDSDFSEKFPFDEESDHQSSNNANTIPMDSPCQEILSAPLSAGMIQINNHVFRVDGSFTLGNLMQVVNKENNDYFFYRYYDTILSLDSYVGDTQYVSVTNSLRDDAPHITAWLLYDEYQPTSYENCLIEELDANSDSYYCLANGFTRGMKISPEELYQYLLEQGLTLDYGYPFEANTFSYNVEDGIPVFDVFVASDANPDFLIRYIFRFESSTTLRSCSMRIIPN